jgi:hypothetical protein
VFDSKHLLLISNVWSWLTNSSSRRWVHFLTWWQRPICRNYGCVSSWSFSSLMSGVVNWSRLLEVEWRHVQRWDQTHHRFVNYCCESLLTSSSYSRSMGPDEQQNWGIHMWLIVKFIKCIGCGCFSSKVSVIKFHQFQRIQFRQYQLTGHDHDTKGHVERLR